MVAYNGYEVFTEDLVNGAHQFSAHTFKVGLTNTAPDAAADEVRADAAELSTSGGYTSGGNTTTISVSRSGATTKVTGTDPTAWTGSGGGFTFRYAFLYNDSQTSPADPLIAYWDYGSSQAVAAGETLTVDFDGTNGIFTITET